MQKSVPKVKLLAYPPYLEDCFAVLLKAGASRFALFGGAVRDADYSAYHRTKTIINDYDVRVWLPANCFKEQEYSLISRLEQSANSTIKPIPTPGNDKIRYWLHCSGYEMDISIRKSLIDETSLESAAVDRALSSDIGLCSIAIDSNRQAWATPEYKADRDNQTLTVYPTHNLERRSNFLKRIQQKFPNHRVIYLQ